MNAKEMIMWELGAKNAKHIKSLEEQTGVNLDHYYNLKINQEWHGRKKTKSLHIFEEMFTPRSYYKNILL